MIETYYTKKDLTKGMKQNKFYYKVIDSNSKRGYNRTIKVYMLCKDYSPLCIGHADINTASFKGDKPTANGIIIDIFKFTTDGYNILNDRVSVYEIW